MNSLVGRSGEPELMLPLMEQGTLCGPPVDMASGAGDGKKFCFS